MQRGLKVALALGGGGARGLAHIGVLKVLQREAVPVDLIVGSSAGALVGAAFAANPDAAAVEQRFLEFLQTQDRELEGFKRIEKIQRSEPYKQDLFHRLARMAEKEVFLSLAVFKSSLLSEKEMRRWVQSVVDDIDMEDTAIAYAATAVDLVTGRQVILRRGSLVQAVMASCAVPGFMPPVKWNEAMLVDGGVLGAVPSHVARRLGAQTVIGVDVGFSLHQPRIIEDGIDVIHRSTEIMNYYLTRHSRAHADVLIEPDVKIVDWIDFPAYRDLIHAGERAAEAKMRAIRSTLRRARKGRLFARISTIFQRSGAESGSEAVFANRRGGLPPDAVVLLPPENDSSVGEDEGE